ncbi:MAG: hypothetical protein SAJ37_07615 [Oscillatoria sp. PMC 1068.18]|nr:hypothetical protein [Oscillatoria sp. PMC 1076.18]MEC4988600.1 hypothetical protein [Oscillatoria sp. PMC 1068.18]
MNKSEFPPGWDEQRVKNLLDYYEKQTEAEAVREDESAFENDEQTMIQIPTALVDVVRELIIKYQNYPTET